MKCKITVIVHPDLIPDTSLKIIGKNKRSTFSWITEWDVIRALENLGHYVSVAAVASSRELRKTLGKVKSGVIFNLLEEIDGRSSLDYKVARICSEYNFALTGENEYSLIKGKDKKKSKLIVKKIGILTPEHYEEKLVKFPAILKFNSEDGSFSINKKNIVTNEKELKARVRFLQKKYDDEIMIEEFIEGKDVYISLMKMNGKLVVFPPRELIFPKSKRPRLEIFSERAKWSLNYQIKTSLYTRFMKGCKITNQLISYSKKIYKEFNFSSAVRIDFRINKNEIYFLEVNPNPNLARDDDFCMSMMKTGFTYEECISHICENALTKKKFRKKAA